MGFPITNIPEILIWEPAYNQNVSPEQRVDILGKIAEKEVKEFSYSEQVAQRSRIRQEISEISKMIFHMRKEGIAETKIQRDLDGMMTNFRTSLYQFDSKMEVYRIEKEQALAQNQERSQSIKKVHYPPSDKFLKCLSKHPLTKDDYIREKGILEFVSSELGAKEKIQPQDDKMIARVVAETMMSPSVAVTMNVTAAVEDCSKQPDLTRSLTDFPLIP